MMFENRYGRLDRILHRIAFRAGSGQEAMADLEDTIFRNTLRGITLKSPVFLSALPRSGTTILLNVLTKTGRFASHTYRDMPFVLCPLLWSRFSRIFSVDLEPRERAHGDGLQVSPDSPEAFEEIIWMHYWKEHYQSDRIEPWEDPERNEAFEAFFDRHQRKIIALRRTGPSEDMRYLSKNNLNIARLAASLRPLRHGVLLIPFRDPVQQAASMLLQHRRFLELHERDPFAQRYMEAVGHFEFGANLRPVNFDNWLEETPGPDDLEFWVRYWNAAYRYVLEHSGPEVHLGSYARLTEEPGMALARLAGIVDIPESTLTPLAPLLHPPRIHPVETAAIGRSVLEEASAIHEELLRRATI